MNSSEYYREYRQKCGEEAAYDKRLQRLKEVQKGLEETAQEGSGAVSRSLGAFREALEQSVRYSARFISAAQAAAEGKEGDSSEDPLLSAAVWELEDEISRIERLKGETQEEKDYYYSQYCRAREEEARAERERKERELQTMLERLCRGETT